MGRSNTFPFEDDRHGFCWHAVLHHLNADTKIVQKHVVCILRHFGFLRVITGGNLRLREIGPFRGRTCAPPIAADNVGGCLLASDELRTRDLAVVLLILEVE